MCTVTEYGADNLDFVSGFGPLFWVGFVEVYSLDFRKGITADYGLSFDCAQLVAQWVDTVSLVGVVYCFVIFFRDNYQQLWGQECFVSAATPFC